MKRLGFLAVALLALLPYLASLHHPLLYDDRTLLDNRWLATEASPASVLTHDYWYGTKHERSDLYRPLTILSLAWNLRATPSKEGIRAVNVLLHVMAVSTLLWLLRVLCRDLGGWGPWPTFGAALFAVHPLASEAVLWAAGRAEILAAIFGMLAFGLLVRVPRCLAVSSLLFLLALMSKESAVSWLLMAVVYLAVTRRALTTGLAGWLAALAVFLILRGAAVGWTTRPAPFVDNPLVTADAATRVANAIVLLARYVARMIWPRTLSIEYGFDQIPVLPLLPWAILAGLAIVAACAAAVITLLRAERRTLVFFLLWIPAAFAVTGNVLFPIGTIFAERLAYLPLMGFCALAGIALAAIPNRVLSFGGLAVVVVACAGRTHVRGGDYRDLATLSHATVTASPRSVKALYNEGRTKLRQGRPAEAAPFLERAVAIWPEYEAARKLLQQAPEQ